MCRGTADRPEARNRFASNWELSTARALAAVHFLTEKAGVDPHRVGAIGYGEYRPLADNATAEGRARNHTSRSEDAIYVDVREWTAKMESEARILQEKLGILTKPKRIHGHVKEYPDVPVADVKMKNPRNKPCPCGSGKKYKHCCLNKQR